MQNIKNNPQTSIKSLWKDEYYSSRLMNDPKRLAQFSLDGGFIREFVSRGIVCDVGCSTGEFMRHINLDAKLYGMEISDRAKDLASDIISFDKDIFTEQDFFDLAIFRGTIQHVDSPFQMIKAAYNALKPGGYVIFLATPNADSILYRLKRNLPFLDWPRNFYIPGSIGLANALKNFGFEVCRIEFPYWNTPYRRFFYDHYSFLKNIFSRGFYPHAFWGSSMNIAARKK